MEMIWHDMIIDHIIEEIADNMFFIAINLLSEKNPFGWDKQFVVGFM